MSMSGMTLRLLTPENPYAKWRAEMCAYHIHKTLSSAPASNSDLAHRALEILAEIRMPEVDVRRANLLAAKAIVLLASVFPAQAAEAIAHAANWP